MDACRTCRGQFQIPKKRKIRTLMSYSEGDDSDGNCERFSVSRLAMTKGLIRKAVTVARRETPSRTEMGVLRGLLCWTAHGVVFKAIGD